MPEHMRTDSLSFQRRTFFRGGEDVSVNDVFQRVPAQLLSAVAWKERVLIASASLLEPYLYYFECFPAQGRAALFAPLALAPDVRAGSSDDIAGAQIEEFRCPQTGLQGQSQKDVIPTPDPSRTIWGGGQSFHFIAIKEVHRSSNMTFAWQGKDLLALEHQGWIIHRHEPEEGADGSQPRIPTAGAIAPIRFNVRQKVAYQRRVQILRFDFGWSLAALLAGKDQQQTKGVTITGNRVRAGFHLRHEPFGKKFVKQLW
jgi:hypothetical protein